MGYTHGWIGKQLEIDTNAFATDTIFDVLAYFNALPGASERDEVWHPAALTGYMRVHNETGTGATVEAVWEGHAAGAHALSETRGYGPAIADGDNDTIAHVPFKKTTLPKLLMRGSGVGGKIYVTFENIVSESGA